MKSSRIVHFVMAMVFLGFAISAGVGAIYQIYAGNAQPTALATLAVGFGIAGGNMMNAFMKGETLVLAHSESE